MKRVIIVHLQYPEPGRVKTRLAESIGDELAAQTYRSITSRVIEQVKSANPDIIAVAYDLSETAVGIREWLRPLLHAFQGETRWYSRSDGDTSQLLRTAVMALFDSEPAAKLAVIGTSCIDLDLKVWDSVWSNLGHKDDVVFGPAASGGFYLIGLTQPHEFLFREVPWSDVETVSRSFETAAERGLRVCQLSERNRVSAATEWETASIEVNKRRCVFFDRDGVVNQSPGQGYVLRFEDFHLNEGIAEAIRWLKDRDWLVILVTSQKGVGKGLMGSEDLEDIHRFMQRELAVSGSAFDGIYAYTGQFDCQNKPKPDPQMILAAIESFHIDPRRSWMVGDADRDIAMGRAAGLAGTIRIAGDKPVEVPADHSLERITELKSLFERIL